MDHVAFRWINNLAVHTSWANAAVKLYASAGIAVFAALLLAAYLSARHRRSREGVARSIWAAGAPLLALMLAQIIGSTVDRARPYETLSNVHVLLGRTSDFSFPSDHATVAGAVAAGLLLAERRWGVAAAIAAVLMAFARVYVGAHYPGDVLAGLALGAATALAGRFVVVPIVRRVIDRVASSPMQRLVTART